jgi:hypothetical protein
VLGLAKPLRDGRDVFMFFDNDAKVRAPADAAALMGRLGVDAPGDRAAVRDRGASRGRRVAA